MNHCHAHNYQLYILYDSMIPYSVGRLYVDPSYHTCTCVSLQAFKTDVNSLPLQLVLSWFEQKAVAVLLSLLSLGIRNIHIGPALPAFVTPNVLAVLVDKFALTPIGDVDSDLKKFAGKK